jgi:hypothetical protein
MAAITAGQRYAQIIRAFLRRPGITQRGRGFGSPALKVRGKMFATLSPRTASAAAARDDAGGYPWLT